jgi:LysM repeat protein
MAEREGRVRVRYVVREGDTLSEIGARFGIAIGSLCRINLVPRDAVLHVGQELVVYVTPDHVPSTGTEVASAAEVDVEDDAAPEDADDEEAAD